MAHPHDPHTERHNRFRRSCLDAARLLLAETPADNLLRPVQPSVRAYGRKSTPSAEYVRLALYAAAKEQGCEITTSMVGSTLYYAKLNRAKAMGELTRQFAERERAIPGYAPLVLISTFDTL